MFLQMNQAFVGVDYLLQVDILVHDVGERIFCIVLFVHFHNLFQFYLGLYYDSGKNTTGKVTSVRNEIDF